MSDENTFDALLTEDRLFPPSDEFRKAANVSDPAVEGLTTPLRPESILSTRAR